MNQVRSHDEPTEAAADASGVVYAFVLTMLIAVLLEFPHLNGPWYWRWKWLNSGLLWTLSLLFPGGALLALGLRGFSTGRREARPIHAITCFTAAAFVLQVLGILIHQKGFLMIRDIVVSPIVTSYFNDAQKIDHVVDWLSRFHTVNLGFHTGTHPPGCVLFFRAWILIVGPAAAPYAGALTLALIASLGVPAVYRFAGLWTTSVDTRLIAAALYAALPAVTGFFPIFDQTYALVTIAVLCTWTRGLSGSFPQAMLSGVFLAVGTFFAYNLVTLGAYFVFSGLEAARRERIPSVVRASVAALLGFLALHGFLALTTGFNAPAAFLRAMSNQEGHKLYMDRPWLACAVFDLYDFVLGGGFVIFALVVLGLRREPPWDLSTRAGTLTALGLCTVLAVDLSGQLRAETARVWMFLQPFMVVPAALAVNALPRPSRINLLFLHWLTLVVLRCKMGFVLA